MGRKKIVKDTSVQETPVVFFLRITDNKDDDIIPAGTDIAYSEITKPTSTNYAELLRSVESSVSLNSETLKSILDKSFFTEYSKETSCFWC